MKTKITLPVLQVIDANGKIIKKTEKNGTRRTAEWLRKFGSEDSPWKLLDYAMAFADHHNEEIRKHYGYFLRTQKRSGLPASECIRKLTGKKQANHKDFREGRFRVEDLLPKDYKG